MNGSCDNGREIRRAVLEERVLAGLKENLMAPEAAAEAMRAWAEETSRLKRERRASGGADRQELASVKKKMAAMIGVIEDGEYVRVVVDRLRELEARQDELEAGWPRPPSPFPTSTRMWRTYHQKVQRLAAALNSPGARDEAAAAIRG